MARKHDFIGLPQPSDSISDANQWVKLQDYGPDTDADPFFSEHAGAITWQGLANIHVVANWREGHDDFLIPNNWLNGDLSD